MLIIWNTNNTVKHIRMENLSQLEDKNGDDEHECNSNHPLECQTDDDLRKRREKKKEE